MEVSIAGLESLMAKLARLGGSVDAAIDKGIGKGVQKIKRDAKVNCPYDTGRLKGSISTEHLEPKVWAVGTNVEYAMFVEFGTGQLGAPGVPHTMQPWRYKDVKGNWHTTNGAPPKPYLYPALLGNREYVFKSCKVELARAIRSAMA